MKRVDVRRRGVGMVCEGNRSMLKVWARDARQVFVCTPENKQPLRAHAFGYWSSELSLCAGDAYRVELDDCVYPDPASLCQPEDVHSWSQVVDTSFAWTDSAWENPPLSDYIFYELHTGTFSGEGTFAGVEAKLDYLRELGITAVELMPLAQFPGTRNWGYDGVFPFAVHYAYGGAKGLQSLVDKCHEKGLAVVLDVVYNHVGPEGNYLSSFGPYFTDKYKTPWGDAVNFDDAGSDQVRDFFIENALMWFRDFHIDALRLDAVHAIKDMSAKHILQEIREYVDELSTFTGKHYHLIVECDLNDRRFLDERSLNGYAMDAQWNDDFHHALRVCAGVERTGYYADFNGPEHLAKAYRDAYVYDGIYSGARAHSFGSKTDGLDGNRFIVFSQNHDQVGNRMFGERTSALHSFEMLKLLAAAVFVSPYLPLIFMGEEWGSGSAFQYFISHSDPELTDAVRKGREEEFSGFCKDGECPDPQAEETFQNSKLDWHKLETYPHKCLHEYYTFLITMRKDLQALHSGDRSGVRTSVTDPSGVLQLYRNANGQDLVCLFNFTKQQQYTDVPGLPENAILLLDSAATQWNGPGTAPQESPSRVLLQPESALIILWR
ncbi:MAG: malto-oligosyltrehalose trehalohydrolase [Chitinophagaceae bacterium]